MRSFYKYYAKNEMQKWDAYDAFHATKQPGFVAFDTGEVILTRYKLQPEHRKVYRDIGVTIAGTDDSHMPKLKAPDGLEIRKSWYDDHGQQEIIIDHHTGIALNCEYDRGHKGDTPEWAHDIPSRFQDACRVYWPGDKRAPVGKGIKVTRPRPMAPVEKEHIQTLANACRAFVAMEYNDHSKVPWCPAEMFDGMMALERTFDVLTNEQRVQIARRGIATPKQVTVYPYLVVCEPIEKHSDEEMYD